MSDILLACDGAAPPSGWKRRKWDKKLDLTHQGRAPTFNLKINNIEAAILRDVDPISNDLIRLASYVYIADQSVSRGRLTDVYGHHWVRDLYFAVPVSDPGFWSRPELKDQLVDILNFLTGDRYTFQFVKGTPAASQLTLDLPSNLSPYDGADSVMLLSGGADSLSALVDMVVKQGKRPILVSHRSIPMLDARQTRIANALRQHIVSWRFPHISVWVHLKGAEAKEYTQRSRSFLYCVLAAAVAHQTKLNEICVADNGVVSLNLPRNAQLVGTAASRSTHPKFLHATECFLQDVFGSQVHLYNPIQFRTRAETVSLLRDSGCPELLQETVSCAHTRQAAMTPHCGVCSQCIDRRIGTLAAGMEEFDLTERYEKDVFTDELPEGPDRAQVEAYVRFARDVEHLSDHDLFRDYVELFDAIIPGDPNPERTAQEWINLLRRHASQVRAVIEGQIAEHGRSLFNATLPGHCLIRLVAAGSHNENPRRRFALKVADRLRRGIPKVFQSRQPKNEHEVQDAADAILSAAQDDFDRELPLLPFAGISTKPDFSNNAMLFIEMKYPKTRSRLNATVTEMSSRLVIYRQQHAYAMFVVYDPHRCISSDDDFVESFVSEESVVVVIR